MPKPRFFFSRPFLLVIGAIVCILAYGYLWGTQTVLAFTFRQQAKKVVILNEKPKPMALVAANSTPGMKLVHAGISFEVPWDDLDVPRCKYGGNIAGFSFQSGRAINFFGPGKNDEGLLGTLERNVGDKKGDLGKLFGPETTRTKYLFQRAVLEETPDKITPFTTEREAVRSSMLLLVKGLEALGGETGLFEVQSNGWKGFQFDDPSKGPKRITLVLYDGQDQHVEIIFYPNTNKNAPVTQADINRTLMSLRPTEEPQTIPLQRTLQNTLRK